MRSTLIASLVTATLAFAAPPVPSKELTEKGKGIFNINCAACHGPKGAGDGPAAVAIKPPPRNYATDSFKNGEKPEEIFKTLTDGIKGTTMVSFAHLPEQDRWALAYYVIELRNAGKPATPDAGAPDAGKPGKPAKKK